MRAGRARLVLAAAAAVTGAAPAGAAGLARGPDRTGFALADFRLADLDGDGGLELLVLGPAGELRLWNGADMQEADLRLGAPGRALVGVWEPVPAAVPESGGGLVAVLDPAGLRAYRYNRESGLAAEPELVFSRVPLDLRVGTPRFAEVLRDVNADGLPDLLVPRGETVELWLERGPGSGESRFERKATVRTDIRRARATQAKALSDRLEESFHIPYLRFEDVNGDRREDLIVVSEQARQFHLLRADNTLPADPDVSLDLEIFRDTTPPAEIRPGRTLAGSDEATLAMQDLDGGGIPDYVIAHRRKLWVFHGGAAGPQFTEPSAILKTAEDVTAALIVPLDDDRFPDLVLVRVQVPTIGSLLKGLFSSVDIEISASGYASEGGRAFSRTPELRSELVIRLPQLMQIMRHPETFLAQLQAASARSRVSVRGDFDGDGAGDVALITPDQARLEIWTAVAGAGAGADPLAFRRFLFGSAARVWSLEEAILGLVEVAERQEAVLVAGLPPTAAIEMNLGPGEEVLALSKARAAAEARDHILVLTQDAAGGGEAVVRVFAAGR